MNYNRLTKEHLLKELKLRDAEGKRVEQNILDFVKEFKKAEKEKTLILENINEIIAYHDTDHNLQWVNKKYQDATGLTLEDVQGRKCYDAWGLGRVCINCPVTKAIETGTAKDAELTPENQPHWPATQGCWSVNAAPVINDKGQTIGAIEIASEITERKQANDELKKTLHDNEERVKELRCLYGVTESLQQRDTLKEIFQDVADLIPPSWHYPEITRGKLVFDGKKYVSKPFKETKWKQSNDIVVNKENRGSIEVYYLKERPKLDEGPFMKEERALIRTLAQTIGKAVERKEAEEALHLQSNIVTNMSEAVYMIRMDNGEIVYTNPSFAKMFGYKPDEMVGQNVAIVNAPTDLDPAETVKVIMAQLEKDGYWEGEVNNIKKNGTCFWCNARVTLFDHSEYGKVLISAHTDITRQKAAEEMQLELQLEQKRLVEELSVKNTSLQEFAYVAVHDLKSPINNLQSLMNLIENEDGVKEESKVLFEKAAISINHLEKKVKLLNEAINITRPVTHNEERLSFDTTLKEIMESNTELIEEAKATIVTDFSKCSYVHYPDIHLRSIMQNLLTNAIKYRRPQLDSVIKFTSDRDKGITSLTVEDNGKGIDLKLHKDKLFGLFKRFHPEVEGVGIGLFMMNSIVRSHSGSIAVESKVNKGTKFKIKLSNEKN